MAEVGISQEEALRAFAESVGMPVDDDESSEEEASLDTAFPEVKQGDEGEILEINWYDYGLEGTLPVGDMHMPYLRKLNLGENSKLKGEARGVGVTVVKYTDSFCE